MRNVILIALLATFVGCDKENLFQEKARYDFWLTHKGADLPIVVEGNTNSKVFILLLHGGPGGSAQEFNSFNQPFTDLLEEKYAMVYYDQRNSGMARGDWNEKLFTVGQHIEDLEKVVSFIEHKFGEDITLFLAGHSWGGYLGTSYLVKDNNQDKIRSWINIDGATNRNQLYLDRLIRIPEIAEEQLLLNTANKEWSEVIQTINDEKQKGIIQYNINSENQLNEITVNAEKILFNTRVITTNVNSTFSGVFSTNYHPFIASANDNRDNTLIRKEMYQTYDEILNENLNTLNLPTLSVYGKYDVRTPLQQGEYLMGKISTLAPNKKLTIIDNAGHSPMRSQPKILATIIINWIEQYK